MRSSRKRASVGQRLAVDREAGRHGVAAAVDQQAGLARGDHRRAEIDAAHRAARALAELAVEADDEGRPAVALDQPAGDDADHADMPALALDHQRRRQALASGPYSPSMRAIA